MKVSLHHAHGTTTFPAQTVRSTHAIMGAVLLREGLLTQHAPRLRDAAEWSAARLANRGWLERAFPAWGEDWAAEQSPSAWVQRCRQLRRDPRLRPSVFRLDGRFVGEIGVDAIDRRTNTGEASAWLIRDHGSADVMQAASLMVIRAAFTAPDPIVRMTSPVASSSRRGRAPGLSAVGFEIEATVPRAVGHDEMVDHDIWVVHNTEQVRDETERRLRVLGEPAQLETGGALHGVSTLAPALARTMARNALSDVRRGRDARHDEQLPAVPVAGGAIVRCHDVGTATAVLAPMVFGTRGDVTSTLLSLAGRVASWAPAARTVEVSLGPDAAWLGADLVRAGFVHVATYPATPDGSARYPGEQIWHRAI